MKITLKKPLSLGGIDYKPGQIHEVPDTLAKDWFFLAHVQNGNIMLSGGKAPILEAINEAPPASVPPPVPSAPVVASEVASEEDETEGEDDLGLGDELDEEDDKPTPKKKGPKKGSKKKG